MDGIWLESKSVYKLCIERGSGTGRQVTCCRVFMGRGCEWLETLCWWHDGNGGRVEAKARTSESGVDDMMKSAYIFFTEDHRST